MRLLMLALASVVVAVTVGCAKPPHHGKGGMGGSKSELGGDYREGSADKAIPEVRAIIERHVKDPDKTRRVEGLLQEIVAEVRASQQRTRGYHEQLNVLNANYEASPEQFMSVLDQLNNSRMQASSKILALRFKIKEMLSADEWKAMTDDMVRVRKRYMH